jgi:hypothetical protein
MADIAYIPLVEKQAAEKKVIVIGKSLQDMQQLLELDETDHGLLQSLKQNLDDLGSKYYLPSNILYEDEYHKKLLLSDEQIGAELLALRRQAHLVDSFDFDNVHMPSQEQFEEICPRYHDNVREVDFQQGQVHDPTRTDPGGGDTDSSTPIRQVVEQQLLRARALKERIGELVILEQLAKERIFDGPERRRRKTEEEDWGFGGDGDVAEGWVR